ncbi:MAG: ribosome small subunit-dependent GTPase A [Ruminococcaceae bacterium]|nr:ribosome small subunit-dependent GTPase A [Oscillospiraceae bacterium]
MFMVKGIILKGVGGLYSVWAEDSGKVFQCAARGIFRKEAKKPLIGDRVTLTEIDEINKTAAISEIAPRRSELRRPAVANIDKLIFAAASSNPKPDLLLLDKMIVCAEIMKIEFVLMISKSDEDPEFAQEIVKQYSPAVKCFVTSAIQSESFKPVVNYIDGYTVVIAGQSGAGKSTFINTVASRNLMDTGGLSEKTGRGKHTTRHSELFNVTEGFEKPTFIIDSPGFSMLEAENIEPIDLQEYYPEMYNNKGMCRFQDCSHTGEPGCFTQELVETGKIHPDRLKRYAIIYKELADKYKNRYK